MDPKDLREKAEKHYSNPATERLIKSQLGRRSAVKIITDDGKVVLRRYNPDGTPINLKSKKQYDYWKTRRMVGVFTEFGKTTPYIMVDLDPPKDVPKEKVRQLARFVAYEMELPGVKPLIIDTGGRGMHVRGYFPNNKKISIEKAREISRAVVNSLKEYFGPQQDDLFKDLRRIKMDLSPFHEKGLVRVVGSMHEQTGEKAKVIEKISELLPDVKLRPHQKDALEHLEKNKGRALFAHGTGTGKTVTSIAAFEKLKEKGKAKRALVITPAALQNNFIDKGIRKFTNSSFGEVGSGKDYELISLEKFRKDPQKYLNQTRADTLIVDEIHRAKNIDSSTYKSLVEASGKVKNVIGLTGSVVSNNPTEVVPLLDIVDPSHTVGSPSTFRRRYTTVHITPGKGFIFRTPPKRETKLKNKKDLESRVGRIIHYLGHEDVEKDMPKLEVIDVHTPMTSFQHKLYNFALGAVDPITRWKIKRGLPVSQREAQHIFGRLLKARQAANSIATHSRKYSLSEAAEKTPKLRKVIDDVLQHLKETHDGQAIVFTHFVRGGADALYAGFKKRGIEPGLYLGAGTMGVTKKSRKQDVEDYLKGKKRVMIITPAGGEGISLDNTTFFAEVDRHFNPERNQQALARGRRIGGQSHRPPEQRKLIVKRYFSTLKPDLLTKIFGRKNFAIDEWIDQIAQRKEKLNKEFRDVLKRDKEK